MRSEGFEPPTFCSVGSAGVVSGVPTRPKSSQICSSGGVLFSDHEICWDELGRPRTQLLAFLLAFFGLGGTESEGFDNFCCPRRVAPVPLMLAIVKTTIVSLIDMFRVV